MKNLRSVSTPLTIEMLIEIRDLYGFILIQAHLMVSCNFPSNLLVHGTVVVKSWDDIHESSEKRKALPIIYSLASHNPFSGSNYELHGYGECQRWDHTSCHYTYFQVQPSGSKIFSGKTELHILKSMLLPSLWWYLECARSWRQPREDCKVLNQRHWWDPKNLHGDPSSLFSPFGSGAKSCLCVLGILGSLTYLPSVQMY